ncbi:Carbon-nitrogen hydrolase [Pseudocohnilembus persalinus]|uniref:Glutamine-dependent NAD(+) synthetase n=1 Tax=Pseudocohnilembus persalinus TaxID=266149 RepID=A0A0V0QMS1_PSEPJ|nr:Carbon-nitrogen hydrolase [Pseudocohnilembus persalinus]|eukprot:KRX03657.1 Carbon-nitrogen hydrolase [Pseudocohnilembus persalinus]
MKNLTQIAKQFSVATKQPKPFARVAVCTLNQWAMDFEQNKKNIMESLKIAKDNNCTIRVGPELEIPGYGCEDHFLEMDTISHSWEVLGEILKSDLTDNMLVDLGMPVYHRSSLFNCRILCLNKQIVLIRPKIFLADSGNYREPRFFTSWYNKADVIDKIELPYDIQQITKQRFVPFGNALVEANDTTLGYEICQELWMTRPMNQMLALDGCEIILNPSASHYETRKFATRTDLIISATKKAGGIYLYSNSRGCDGGRVYYDGNSIIAQNGKILQMSDMFSVKEVDVLINDVDLESVRQYRAGLRDQFGLQSTTEKILPRVQADITVGNIDFYDAMQEIMDEKQYKMGEDEEIQYGPSYFLALSGGADSASSALIIYNMCKLVFEAIEKDDQKVLESLRTIVKQKDYYPQSPKEICSKILYTGYMGSDNSSKITKDRAQLLANEIGSTHYNLSITDIYNAFEDSTSKVFGQKPKFSNQGGTWYEDIALQNIQARSRMILAYLMGGLIPWQVQKHGFLLVVGSANLDEGLRGYFTKYDCSAADINPIGSISKTDIKKFLKWNYESLGIQAAGQILNAVPTAELRPLDKDDQIVQDDETDMGMSYDDLKYYGQMRKVQKLGPVSMFKQLLEVWCHLSPEQVSTKVKHFFKTYAQNRHKQTTLTPSYHVENYAIDDNRFDLRQFLYNPNWTYQFKKIDQMVEQINEQRKNQKK